MKQKMIFLLSLYCTSLFSVNVHDSQTVCRIGATALVQDSVPEQEATLVVEGFYRSYTDNYLHGTQLKGEEIMKKYLTKRLIEKIDRMVSATGVNPIIRAQDFNETAFETLKVKPLGDNWYMVNYRWYENDDSSNTNIPLKVTLVDGRYMIDYITPIWSGSLSGDTLLCENLPLHPIEDTSPRAMLESFYEAYISLYSSMPEGLLSQLEALRVAHLTPNAQKQFNQASVNMYELDRVRNYDLLIDYFDFDCLWIPSMTYTPLSENTFQVSYVKWGNLVSTIIIEIIEFDGEYKIDSICVEK